MNENFAVEPEVLKTKITAETARISWLELQKFYASGAVLQVSAQLDLVDVAYAFAVDDKTQVASWLAQHQIARVEPAEAQQWYEQKAELWAVVISPWVLVQQTTRDTH
ncbi:DUF2288 domain-containing protein [Rheinheimera sp. 4Y26]|uniref:DUF2288 domain-containing protein n=1 Tax=Rheinheimera sp. 4Y26 TaxID=2977811 RepID=UPI0021B14CAE|nr:DUF2288 domain-containing protein [Rheinheimera sp. 4Y26]MCT6701111.1 DUF2288 domain-containing protein [Rheinheimera sp. 4Y26]